MRYQDVEIYLKFTRTAHDRIRIVERSTSFLASSAPISRSALVNASYIGHDITKGQRLANRTPVRHPSRPKRQRPERCGHLSESHRLSRRATVRSPLQATCVSRTYACMGPMVGPHGSCQRAAIETKEAAMNST